MLKSASKQVNEEEMMGKEVTRDLQVILSEKDKLIYAGDLAKAEQDKISAEERKKELMDEFKSKLSQLDCEIGKKSRAINNGYEYRDIKCRWEFDWDIGTKSLMRLDTFEVIESTEISEYEKQQEMKLEGGEK